MAQRDEISLMTNEVMQSVQEKGVNFHRAFSWAAHKRGIRHCEDRERYNYFFKQVLDRFKSRNRPVLKKATAGPRPWQHGKIIRDTIPRGISPRRLKPGIETEVGENPFRPLS